MKQFQLQQVKFPKPQLPSQPNAHSAKTARKTNAQSQLIRIVIALLIAIFIFNSSQQTTINYNEIIKNQKMFLVKNTRGVIPTLSGNIYKLQNSWKVVHFENYKQNDSELFNNFTLFFNADSLILQNHYCNTQLIYDWKNYSYNIDFSLLVDNTRPITAINLQHNSSANQHNQSNMRNLQGNSDAKTQSALSPLNSKDDLIDPPSQVLNDNQTDTIQDQTNPPTSKLQQDIIPKAVPSETQGEKGLSQLSEEQQKCTKSINYFKEVILFTSVFTISSKNLYLLMENANMDEDFYIILNPIG